MAAYEIIIADDHPLFRSALQQALTMGLGENVRLVEAASIAELEGFLNQGADWDLVLLDLNMPGPMAFPVWCSEGQYPHLPVVMISAQEDAAVVARSREFGASGFIPKSSSLETIQEAVRAVLEGTSGGRATFRTKRMSVRKPRRPAPDWPASLRSNSAS